MSWWKRIFHDERDREDVDYYREGLDLLRVSKFHEALTSFRLALREAPGDVAVLQQIAIAYTRIGMTDEAVKTYRSVLAKDPRAMGAHYGLAFLLLHQGDTAEAAEHLRAFLSDPPRGTDADRHISYARETLAGIEGGSLVEPMVEE
jgi:tetratricopeptide (TPR) repeat protein